MPNTPHRHPHYALRIATPTMDKLKYIAGHNGRSANKEIEQLILAHIDAYEFWLILQAMKESTARLF